MVAEDHKQYSHALCEILKDNFEGCTVEAVFDGAALLAATEKKKYNVILIDIQMPEMNGLLATREIISKDKDAKIIVVSFFDSLANMQLAIRFGAKGFVTKSDDIKNIINAVSTVLDGNFYGAGKEMKKLLVITIMCAGFLLGPWLSEENAKLVDLSRTELVERNYRVQATLKEERCLTEAIYYEAGTFQ